MQNHVFKVSLNFGYFTLTAHYAAGHDYTAVIRFDPSYHLSRSFVWLISSTCPVQKPLQSQGQLA